MFRDCRTEAVTRAWNSPDLTPGDRIRVATLVAEQIDATSKLGAVPGPDQSLGVIAPSGCPLPTRPNCGT